jgi:N-formylglutamate amidohydrolase
VANRVFGCARSGSYHRHAVRVVALTIEVSHSHYMDETSGERLPVFQQVAPLLSHTVERLIEKAQGLLGGRHP